MQRETRGLGAQLRCTIFTRGVRPHCGQVLCCGPRTACRGRDTWLCPHGATQGGTPLRTAGGGRAGPAGRQTPRMTRRWAAGGRPGETRGQGSRGRMSGRGDCTRKCPKAGRRGCGKKEVCERLERSQSRLRARAPRDPGVCPQQGREPLWRPDWGGQESLGSRLGCCQRRGEWGLDQRAGRPSS